MNRRPGSLYKQHRAGCPNAKAKLDDLFRCDCAVSGAYKGKERVLANWLKRDVDPRSKKKSYEALALFTTAIDNGTFDHPVATAAATDGSGWTLAQLVDEFTTHHVDKHKQTSTGTKPMLNVIKRGSIGKRPLAELVKKARLIEDWLDATGRTRKWEGVTWNKYHALLYTVFEKATIWKDAAGEPRALRNPMKEVDLRPERKPSHFKRRHLGEDVEARLFAACELLDQFDEGRKITKAALTQQQVDAIRARVERGELQKRVAKAFKISEATCSAIVLGKTWNKKLQRRSTRGAEMRRRLIAGFDGGMRLAEMLKTKIKHVQWTLVKIDGAVGYRIVLPPEITKGGKSSGENETIYAMTPRFVKMLDARRLQLRRQNETTGKWEPNPEAFIFGTEAGHYQASFDKTGPRLFKLAGLDWGRDQGLVWHQIRHEYISRVGEQTKDPMLTQELARHRDFETTQGYMTQRDETKARAAAGLAKGSSR
jgi:hypothetical protein